MFYCESCRMRNSWPESMANSLGRCEVCHRNSLCYDVPSSQIGPGLPTNNIASKPLPEKPNSREVYTALVDMVDKLQPYRFDKQLGPAFVILETLVACMEYGNTYALMEYIVPWLEKMNNQLISQSLTQSVTRVGEKNS